MFPNVIVVDKKCIEKDTGAPIKGALIFDDCIVVHPDELEKVKTGLELMTGQTFILKTREEYSGNVISKTVH